MNPKRISASNLVVSGFVFGLATGLLVALAGKQDKDDDDNGSRLDG
jgi:hypothetical protein